MDVMEKLVELVDKARRYAANKCHSFMSCAECDHYGEHDGNCRNTYIAESLIADGVTVQEWISVSEPPEENGYYLCYVLTSAVGDKAKYEQMPLYWEDDIWLYRHNSYRMCRNVTYWMPLPTAPEVKK